MSFSTFLNKQKKLYKGLQPCFCAAIKTNVYFTSDGLNHLLYHKRRPRNFKEKIYRAALITYIREVIERSPKASELNFLDPPSVLWVLDWVEVEDNNNQKHLIKVILRKKGNGNVHFWSVMQKKEKTANK